jgi:hypothetical protein
MKDVKPAVTMYQGNAVSVNVSKIEFSWRIILYVVYNLYWGGGAMHMS